MMTVAEQSLQRAEALAKANQTRLAASLARQEVRGCSHQDGRALVAQFLEDNDPRVGCVPAGRLLSSIWRLRTASVSRLLSAAGIVSWDRRVDKLTDRQRHALASELRS